MLKIDCAPRATTPEVVVERDVRCRTGLTVTRSHVPDADRCYAGRCLVTSPLVTAWDLTRRFDLVDAVIALDALAAYRSPIEEPFPPSALLDLREKRRGARGCGRLDRVVHVHLADTPGRGEPGSGRMDYAERLEWLEAQGYDGLIGLEYKPSGPTVETLKFRELV